ncbi:HET-domain-containing protein [Ophiobolus disseminans]|uniref:HET-domain-containing protein n=1 Tax=Ophiobolus disseminans TaxID=1469910 RepID=A0A6A6ZY85_9PLEO|nr:HET-domain-containing protein [Ophiobolus disseminans]
MEGPSVTDTHGVVYETLPSSTSIRVLQIESVASQDDAMLSCTLHMVDLANPALNFNALSYTWGDPFYRSWYEKAPGIQDQGARIDCNGTKMNITLNLHAALQIIAQRQSTRADSSDHVDYLWVDSLCINQLDVEERNSQVRLMAQIYSKALLVISWLGPADEDSNVAITFIERLMPDGDWPIVAAFKFAEGILSFEERSSGQTLSISVDHLRKLARFVARRYFFRCWVIQEIVLARQLCILCGPSEVQIKSLHYIAYFMQTLRKQLNLAQPVAEALTLAIKPLRGVAHEQAIDTICSWRQTRVQQDAGLNYFQGLLRLTRSTGCFDPRDKVYGMLGMMDLMTPYNMGISPDYNKGVDEVYSEAIRLWINMSHGITILSWVTNKPARRFPSFPTWIGEFEMNANQQELAPDTDMYNATSGSCAARVDLKRGSDFRILTLRGGIMDHIVELAQPWDWHGRAVGYDPIWASLTRKLPVGYWTGQTRGEALIHTFVAGAINGTPIGSMKVKQSDSSSMSLEEFKKRVRRDTCFALVRQLHRICFYTPTLSTSTAYINAARPILDDMDALATSDDSNYLPSRFEIQDLEKYTCECAFTFSDPESNTEAPSANAACPYITELERDTAHSSGIIPHAPNVPDAEGWDSLFPNAMNQKMYMRRVARTGKGYLALVPDSAEVGDAMWLLKGGSVPFVLRQASAQNDEKTLRTWEVVGEAYVHGAMNGEIWEQLSEHDLEDVHLV